MSSRLTLRANALSFIFFLTDFASTSARDFPGFTSAHAVMNPASSSQANRVFSIGVSRLTPVYLALGMMGRRIWSGQARLVRCLPYAFPRWSPTFLDRHGLSPADYVAAWNQG